MGKKMTVRDLIQAKIEGKDLPQDLAEYQSQVLSLIPKINEVPNPIINFQMLFDEQSCAMLMKGRIQVQNKLLSLNVISIFTSFAEVTDQLLREGTRSVS